MAGSDNSWSTPQNTHTYFRNVTLWGGSSPSKLSGEKARSSATEKMVQNIILPLPLVVGLMALWNY